MPATPRTRPAACLLFILFAAATCALPASAELVIVSGDAKATAAAWNDMGNGYASQLRWDAAIDAYSRAISLEPGYARAYFNRGKAYAALKWYDQAIADYEQAIAIDPSQGAVVRPFLESALAVRYPSIPSGSLVKGYWQAGGHFLAIDNSQGTSDLVVALAHADQRVPSLRSTSRKGIRTALTRSCPRGPTMSTSPSANGGTPQRRHLQRWGGI